ncbi:MAG TPA: shikimate kinase, partial [Flavobacteriales bacterium]|nr:shikimate kinase [Flavobacteriales bacterium]
IDRVIEQRVGPIKPFFEREGEAAFRAVETQVLHELLAAPPAVIAMGGGTPCEGDNLERMKAAGTVVWLDVPMDVLMPRIERSGGDRPLLAGLSGEQLRTRVQQLLEPRVPFYSQADLRINAVGTPTELTERIAALLQAR